MTSFGKILKNLSQAIIAAELFFCAHAAVGLNEGVVFDLQEKIYSVFEQHKDSAVKVYAQKKISLVDKDGKIHEKTTLDVGSGFIVGKDGVFMTSAFIINGANKIWVEWRGFLLDAEIVGMDPLTSVAVIRSHQNIKSKKPTVVHFDTSYPLPRPASVLLSVSYEMGLPPAPRMGMLSGHNIQFGGRFLPTVYLRTDINSSRGSIGCAVFDISGKFVGIIIATLPDSAGSFILPASAAAKIRDDIILCGEPVYSWFGIQAEDALDIESERGTKISITLVAENGPAKKAGFQTGDVIQEIDGLKVENNTQLRERTFFVRPGQTSKMRILREGKTVSLEIIAEKMSYDVIKLNADKKEKARQDEKSFEKISGENEMDAKIENSKKDDEADSGANSRRETGALPQSRAEKGRI